MTMPLGRKAVQPLIHLALREDQSSRDITSAVLLSTHQRIQARIRVKAPGVFAGGPIAVWVLKTVDPSVKCRVLCREGSSVRRGQTALTIQGRARSIFAAERTALNFLGHLSGIATLTRAYVERVRPYHVQILDTRKTLPGLRVLEKYAVRTGGGYNHRMDLREAILIKTNHVLAYSGQRTAFSEQRIASRKGSIPETIQRLVKQAKHSTGKRFVEVEVRNLREFEAAIGAGPDAILLDNWNVHDIRKAVALRREVCTLSSVRCLLEVSGGVTLANVRTIAKTGVDRISVGRLTHSAPALDVSLEVNHDD